MARARPRYFRFENGVQNTAGEVGLEQPWLARGDNCRVNRGDVERRKGMARLGAIPDQYKGGSFSGTQQVDVPLDLRVHELGLRFEIEILMSSSDLAGATDRYLIGWAHASDYPARIHYQSGKIKADVQDSAGTVVSLESSSTFANNDILAIVLTREAGTLTLIVNDAAEDTDTTFSTTLKCKAPGGGLQIGAYNGANRHIGPIDFLRARNAIRGTRRGGWLRLLNPRSRPVLWDYDLVDDGNMVRDRSRFENHGETNTGTLTATAVTTAIGRPVQGLREVKDPQGKRRLAAVAGGKVYMGDL